VSVEIVITPLWTSHSVGAISVLILLISTLNPLQLYSLRDRKMLIVSCDLNILQIVRVLAKRYQRRRHSMLTDLFVISIPNVWLNLLRVKKILKCLCAVLAHVYVYR
jgi:hypothetical protein